MAYALPGQQSNRVPLQGFVGSAFSAQSVNVDCQDLWNWYLERSDSPAAKTPNSLLPCPGFTVYVVLPTGPVRGLFTVNDRVFAVGGSTLYEISRTQTVTPRTITVLATPSTPTITNSPLASPLAQPLSPVISPAGSVGTTAYGYKVTALNTNGETNASLEGLTAFGNASLSVTNFNQVSWQAVTGATGYNIYRTTAPTTTPVLVGTVAANVLYFQDIGTVGTSVTPPSVNTTGGVAGATTYGYEIVARLGLGFTAGSAQGVTNTGQAALTANNYNIITWGAVPFASSYDVYRTAGGASPPVFLGNTTSTTMNDTGQVGTAQAPPVAASFATDLGNDGAPVQFATSGDAGQQLIVVSAGHAYTFDLVTSRLGQVVTGATACGYISGYFLVLDAGSSTLKASELLDGFTWDASQLYQRLSSGDKWLAMGVTTNDIWLFGSNATDIYRFTGDTNTRFAPFQGIVVAQGILAVSSLTVTGGILTWLGQNQQGSGTIYRNGEGYDAEPISTQGMANEIEQYATLGDAVSFSYLQGRHPFYILNFPTAGKTWGFDAATNEWHRRGYWNPNNRAFTVYRPQCHTYAWGGITQGLHLVGDSQSGTVAVMDPTVSTDIDGSLVRRVRRAPHLSALMLESTVYSLIFDLEVGLGTDTGQGQNPTMMLRVSKDGSKTWGSERWKAAGPKGAYKQRVKYNRFGLTRDWVFELVCTDPVPYRIAAAYFEPGDATE